MQIKKTVSDFWYDYTFRTFVTSTLSLLSTVAFLLYNFAVGVIYGSFWNLSIGIYYMLLIILRALILLSEWNWRNTPSNMLKTKRIILFRRVCSILILVDLALTVPIILMLLSQRAVHSTHLTAIVVALYTVYKVIIALVNYFKTKKGDNLSLFGLKVINLKDAVVSVLTLQNTLIMVFGNSEKNTLLPVITSTVIMAGMIILTVVLQKRGNRMYREI